MIYNSIKVILDSTYLIAYVVKTSLQTMMNAPQAPVKTVQLAMTKSTLTLALASMDMMEKTVKTVIMLHN